MKTIKMDDLVKSGLFGLALFAMLMIASFQITEQGAKMKGDLADNEVITEKKLELANKEEIDIPL